MKYTVLNCVVGSQSYGIATDVSDVDRIKVFVLPTVDWMGLTDPPDVRVGKNEGGDYTEWELRKYLGLALKGNPGALELLYTTDHCVTEANEEGRFLREHREWFLSKQLYPRYRGFVYSQFNRMHKDGRSKHGHKIPEGQTYDYKAGAHALRLLWQATAALNENTLTVSMCNYPNYKLLMNVRQGETTLSALLNHIENGLQVLDRAYAASTLPDEPQTRRVSDWLIDLRQRYL